MAQATHRSANGKMIAMETLRLENEKTIAVGNMKVNARGDTLGPGGRPMATKQETVNEYYNLHTPTIGGNQVVPAQAVLREQQFDAPSADPLIEEQDAFDVEATPAPAPQKPNPHNVSAPAGQKPVRGSLAASVAQKPIDIKQELMKSAKQQHKAKGPARF
jgi:hypothetical protein